MKKAMTNQYPNARAALFGALVGDAQGVPYEFNRMANLPAIEHLEMSPPADFNRSHLGTPEGTWSDDGALMLALQAELSVPGPFNLEGYARRMVAWRKRGDYTPDGRVFDIGGQTANGLRRFQEGTPAHSSGEADEYSNGNGSLMRVLPVAWHADSDETAVQVAREQGLPTHGHIRSQLCCALYVLIARRLLSGMDLSSALESAKSKLLELLPDAGEQLSARGLWEFRKPGRGSGYVVDCLWSAIDCLEQTDSFEAAIKRAVYLGDDTDTTACVTGGLAGALYGMTAIPDRWLQALRGRKLVDSLWDARGVV